jgi:hypothetical protein
VRGPGLLKVRLEGGGGKGGAHLGRGWGEGSTVRLAGAPKFDCGTVHTSTTHHNGQSKRQGPPRRTWSRPALRGALSWRAFCRPSQPCGTRTPGGWRSLLALFGLFGISCF